MNETDPFATDIRKAAMQAEEGGKVSEMRVEVKKVEIRTPEHVCWCREGQGKSARYRTSTQRQEERTLLTEHLPCYENPDSSDLSSSLYYHKQPCRENSRDEQPNNSNISPCESGGVYRESEEEGSDGEQEEGCSGEIEGREKAASLVVVMREARWSREEDEEGYEGDDEEGKLGVEGGLLE